MNLLSKASRVFTIDHSLSFRSRALETIGSLRYVRSIYIFLLDNTSSQIFLYFLRQSRIVQFNLKLLIWHYCHCLLRFRIEYQMFHFHTFLEQPQVLVPIPAGFISELRGINGMATISLTDTARDGR